jgi:hypothetical protein
LGGALNLVEQLNFGNEAPLADSETWGVKYDKAVECLAKDRDAVLAFYEFPAEHRKHLRTNSVIESSFATVRHRTVSSKGCLSNKTALAMIFKLAESAEKSWRRLDGHNQLPKVILCVKFFDGIEVVILDRKLKPLPPETSARCARYFFQAAGLNATKSL